MAKLGDKTQLAAVLFASDRKVSKWLVFVDASCVVIATSAIGVLGGGLLARQVSERTLRMVAGIGFIANGVWILWR